VIAAKLVYRTGSYIRFRPLQLAELPAVGDDIQVVLPDGSIVPGSVNRNPANPNVTGAELIRFIKRRLASDTTEDILLEFRTPLVWVVHLLDEALPVAREAHIPVGHVRGGALQPPDLAALMALADRENDRGRRLGTYKRVLRPAGLRRLVIGVVGARCMVDACGACQQFDADWGVGSGDVIVEVHHVEEVARTIDHHPQNLCVLCANHHRFVHNSGSWTVRHDGPNVVLGRGAREMLIVRPAALFPAA